MTTLFKRARLVDARRDELGDLLVEDGKIVAIGPPGSIAARVRTHELDCAREGGEALALLPAFVDLHAHLRDPGFPEKETVKSASLAAAAGGFGSLVAMANTRPVTDSAELALETRARAAKLGLVEVFPAIALTRDLAGRDSSHLADLEAALRADDATEPRLGLRLLSDDGRDSADDEVMYEAMQRARSLGLVVACHCERGPTSPPDGVSPESWYASVEGLAADREAEIAGVERALRLARETGCALHLCHLSTKESVELARREKAALRASHSPEDPTAAQESHRITCEVTPHHLAMDFDESIAAGAAGRGRVNPWLRREEDREALMEGLLDGTIDALATDHAPHTTADKTSGAPGFSGFETGFALFLGALLERDARAPIASPGSGDDRSSRRGLLSLLSKAMSANPASILGLRDRGLLEPGMRADLVLVDPSAEWEVDPRLFRSRGRNSLLAGWRLSGRVLLTLHKGRIVYDQL